MPDTPPSRSDEAAALQKRAFDALAAGELSRAAAIQSDAHDAAPEDSRILNNLGVLRDIAGDRAGALDVFRRLAARPDAPFEAWHNLGLTALANEAADEARVALERAVAINAGSDAAYSALAFACLRLGDAVAARAFFKRTAEIASDNASHWSNLGNACRESGAFGEAKDALDRALALDPAHADARFNLATLSCAVGEPEDGLAGFEMLIQAKPDRFDAHVHRCFGRISDPESSGESLLGFARAASTAIVRPTAASPAARARKQDGRLKVALLSPDFREHSCAYFLAPLFAARDRAHVSLHAYADFSRHAPDKTSERFRQTADTWVPVAGMSPEAVSAHMRDAGIDIMIDLAGYTGETTIPVCVHRPAPTIASWLGYPASTGIPEIDYRIGDAIVDPEGAADRHFSEKIARLPGPFVCYAPPDDAPRVAPPPSMKGRGIVFGSFNSLHKINRQTVRAWARILVAVPGSRLLLKGPFGTQPRARARLHRMFSESGLDIDRLELVDMQADRRVHLDFYARIDIALDTFPYNGTTTTCEALWMGVPLVTLAGDRHAARVGATLLGHAGLGTWVADTVDGYVAIAVGLAADRAALPALRRDLRQKIETGPLVDAVGWTGEFIRLLARLAEAGRQAAVSGPQIGEYAGPG